MARFLSRLPNLKMVQNRLTNVRIEMKEIIVYLLICSLNLNTMTVVNTGYNCISEPWVQSQSHEGLFECLGMVDLIHTIIISPLKI